MYLIQGRQKNGRPAYVGGGGEGAFFADMPHDAMLVASPRMAKGLLGSVPRMASYHRGGEMKMDSFAVHRAEIEMVPVALDDGVRARLAEERSAAPRGWRYLVIDEAGERFAAPERNWSPSTSSISEAVTVEDLGLAVTVLDRMGDGWRLVVGRVVVQPAPMSAQELEAEIAREAKAQLPEPDEDLSAAPVFVPRF